MEALDGALKPAITDIEVSWHLPEGYDVIPSPSKVHFIFDGERVVLYGILSRPADVEKESQKTPQRKRMDTLMRSFSNNSVKVFWFDDDMEYLPEEQLLLELDEQESMESGESVFEDGNEPEIRMRVEDSGVGKVDHDCQTLEARNMNIERIKTASKDDNKQRIAENFVKASAGEAFRKRANTWTDPTYLPIPSASSTFRDIDVARDIAFGSFFKSCESFGTVDCTKDGKPVSTEPRPQLKRHRFALERNLSKSDQNTSTAGKSDPDTNTSRKLTKDESTSQQTSERDSGLGFSIDDAENDDNVLKPGTKAPQNSMSSNSDCRVIDTSKVHVFKNSEVLGAIEVPKDFAAVGIKGYFGDEEIEQVISV